MLSLSLFFAGLGSIGFDVCFANDAPPAIEVISHQCSQCFGRLNGDFYALIGQRCSGFRDI